MDSDTLADISCSDGDVPKWDGVAGEWYCGLDNDTQFLTELEVENLHSSFAENTTIGGESIVTPTTDQDSLGDLNCNQNEITVFNGSIWECQPKIKGFGRPEIVIH